MFYYYDCIITVPFCSVLFCSVCCAYNMYRIKR